MWQGLLIRIPNPNVRLPLRNLSIGSLKSKGNDEKVVNKQCNVIIFNQASLSWKVFFIKNVCTFIVKLFSKYFKN